jgi:hypothetical protein
MAKSSTQKKSKNKKNIPTVQEIEKFVDQTVDYIKTWQSKELKPLLTKTDAHDEIKDIPLILVSDVTLYFSGNTMSYVEFS